jgi:O-antigen/teichoic acid export membrane protein
MIKKYKALPAPLKASLWFTICSILQKSLSIITLPLYTRLLTTNEYGLSIIFLSWLDIVDVIATLRLSAGVFNNGMIHYEHDRDRFSSAMLGLSTVSSFLCLLIYLFFWEKWSNVFELPFYAALGMFVLSIFSPAMKYWMARKRYEYKYIGFTIATFIIAVISSSASVLAIILSNRKGEAKIYGYLISLILIYIFFYVYILYKGKAFFVKSYWLYALKFNIPLIPHYLSMIVLGQVDRIMISKMKGMEYAAIYGVAYSIGKIPLVINASISASFIPWIYQRIKNKDYKNIAKISNTLFILICCLSCGLMLFAPEIIMIFSTTSYYEAIEIVPPIAASVFFTFIYNQVSTVEFYFGKTIYIMYASVIGTIINVFLNYFAINMFGYIAAAYTTMICYILFALFHYIVMKTQCKHNDIKDHIFDGKFIVTLSIGLLIFVVIVEAAYSNIILRYILILILFVLFMLYRRTIQKNIAALKSK